MVVGISGRVVAIVVGISAGASVVEACIAAGAFVCSGASPTFCVALIDGVGGFHRLASAIVYELCVAVTCAIGGPLYRAGAICVPGGMDTAICVEIGTPLGSIASATSATQAATAISISLYTHAVSFFFPSASHTRRSRDAHNEQAAQISPKKNFLFCDPIHTVCDIVISECHKCPPALCPVLNVTRTEERLLCDVRPSAAEWQVQKTNTITALHIPNHRHSHATSASSSSRPIATSPIAIPTSSSAKACPPLLP